MSKALNDVACALREARRTRQAIPAVSVTYGISDLEAAYSIAEANVHAAVAEGRRVVGKKVGLTSKAVQQQLGVDQPDFGVLFRDMEILSGSEIPMAKLIQPRVEAEVAFVVGSDLDGDDPSWAEFCRCLDYALPAMEIVDSAILDWKIGIFDTVADNASSGLYVLGDQPRGIGDVSFQEVAMHIKQNGHTVGIGSGAACLGHPLRAAYWLACTMAGRRQPLRAGEVILSGALGPMFTPRKGDFLEASIGALGSVSCRFA